MPRRVSTRITGPKNKLKFYKYILKNFQDKFESVNTLKLDEVLY